MSVLIRAAIKKYLIDSGESDSDSLLDTNKNTFDIDLVSDEDDLEFEIKDLICKNSAADQNASVTENIQN